MSKVILPDGWEAGEVVVDKFPDVAKKLSSAQYFTVYNYQPGNGTRYIVSFADSSMPEVAWQAIGGSPHTMCMMVLHNIGTNRAVFVGTNTQTWDIVEKLGIGLIDAIALCFLIRFHATHDSYEFPGGDETCRLH